MLANSSRKEEKEKLRRVGRRAKPLRTANEWPHFSSSLVWAMLPCQPRRAQPADSSRPNQGQPVAYGDSGKLRAESSQLHKAKHRNPRLGGVSLLRAMSISILPCVASRIRAKVRFYRNDPSQ
jgi:hypothetical protein